jgi:hypothetical protein
MNWRDKYSSSQEAALMKKGSSNLIISHLWRVKVIEEETIVSLMILNSKYWLHNWKKNKKVWFKTWRLRYKRK